MNLLHFLREIRNELYLIKEGICNLANDFSRLNAAVTDLSGTVSAVVDELKQLGADQATIDSLTSQVEAAVAALKAAQPSTTPAPAPATDGTTPTQP